MAPRRGQQRKRAQRRDDAMRDDALGAHQGSYVPPPRDECVLTEAFWPWGRNGFIRIDAWKWVNSEGLADFALSASVTDYGQGDWNTVNLARVDIRHGHAHIHLLHPEESAKPVHIRRLDTQSDVQEAYRAAIIVLQKIADRLDGERNT